MKNNFDTFLYTRYNLDLGSNVISRIRNALVDALNERLKLPKIILVVVDDDMIIDTKHPKSGISLILGKNLEYLLGEMFRLITTRKDQVAQKCKKAKEPQIIWIKAPNHINLYDGTNRKKFNNCLEASLPFYTDMCYLKLKDRWDFKRKQLCKNNKFTAEGLSSYWESIDSGVKYWTSKIWPQKSSIGKQLYNKQKPVQYQENYRKNQTQDDNQTNNRNYDRYKWTSEQYNAEKRYHLQAPPRRFFDRNPKNYY